MTEPRFNQESVNTRLVVEESDLELELATHFSLAESSEGAYLYFGKIVAPGLWEHRERPKEPTSHLKIVAKLFLPGFTMEQLRKLLVAKKQGAQ